MIEKLKREEFDMDCVGGLEYNFSEVSSFFKNVVLHYFGQSRSNSHDLSSCFYNIKFYPLTSQVLVSYVV